MFSPPTNLSHWNCSFQGRGAKKRERGPFSLGYFTLEIATAGCFCWRNLTGSQNSTNTGMDFVLYSGPQNGAMFPGAVILLSKSRQPMLAFLYLISAGGNLKWHRISAWAVMCSPHCVKLCSQTAKMTQSGERLKPFLPKHGGPTDSSRTQHIQELRKTCTS